MTTFDLDKNTAHYQIRAYEPGKLQINEKIYTQSVIVTPDKIFENWAPQTVQDLKTAQLISIIDLKPDILLIGTGRSFTIIGLEIYGELINKGIGVEFMDTAAACRTYNALTSEERNVVAALIIR